MGLKKLIAVVVVVLLFASVAGADVLKLSNGGSLRGSLKEVTFLIDGKEMTYAREKVESFRIAAAGKDSIVLGDGAKREGEFLSLAFRSVGGVLKFERKDVKDVEFAENALTKARKELAAKKAGVSDDDPAALAGLAVWCRDKGLAADARKYAEASLALADDGESATTAHKALGHVQYKGKWMTVTQADKLKAADNAGGDHADTTPVEPDPTPKNPKLSPEQVAALKAAFSRNDGLYKDYKAKVESIRNDEVNKAKDKYGSDFKATMKKYNTVKKQIESIQKQYQKQLDDYEEKYAKYKNMGKEYYDKYKPEVPAELTRKKNELAPLSRRLRAIRAAAQRANEIIGERASTRRDRVSQAYHRIKDKLYLNHMLTDAQMSEMYEAALKID